MKFFMKNRRTVSEQFIVNRKNPSLLQIERRSGTNKTTKTQMNKFLTLTTIDNIDELLEKLDYCKKHSSKKTYQKVLHSFIKSVLFIVIICLVYAVILWCGVDYSIKQTNSLVNENDISFSFAKTGHIRSGELYYIDNEKYVVNMSDFGYDINDYESGTDFTIYLDENHNIVDIILVDKNEITSSDKIVYWIIGPTICAAFILIFYAIWTRYSKSSLNPGKEWNKYCRWLETRDSSETWYYG